MIKFEKIRFIVYLIFTVLCFIGCTVPTVTPSPTPFPKSRKIGSATLPLQEKWRIKSGLIWTTALNRHAWQRTKQGLVFANHEGQLVLLDQNGQLSWKVQYDDSDTWAWSLAANGERVYLVSGWRIHAFNLANGELLWQSNKQSPHRGYYLFLQDQILFEYEIPPLEEAVIYRFNSKTGEKLNPIVLPASLPIIEELVGSIYLGQADGWLWAVEVDSQSVLWRLPRGSGPVKTPPVIVNDLLVLTSGTNLMVIQLQNGQLVWEKQSFAVSNPVVLGNTIYIITEDSSIRAYSLTSGQELGALQVEPPVTITSQYSYALTVDPGSSTVYAYYGDTEEIIVFGK